MLSGKFSERNYKILEFLGFNGDFRSSAFRLTEDKDRSALLYCRMKGGYPRYYVKVGSEMDFIYLPEETLALMDEAWRKWSLEGKVVPIPAILEAAH